MTQQALPGFQRMSTSARRPAAVTSMISRRSVSRSGRTTWSPGPRSGSCIR